MMAFKNRAHPILVAHRGGAGLYLENSLPAFQNAIDVGFEAIECDIQITDDGTLLIYHDFEINQSYTKGPQAALENREIRHLTHEDLTTLTLVDPVHGLHSPIPTLDKLLILSANSKSQPLLFLEIKTNPHTHDNATCIRIVDAIMTQVRALYDERLVTLLSFDWRNFAYIQQAYHHMIATFVYSLETHHRQSPYNPWFGPYETEPEVLVLSLKKFGAHVISVPYDLATDDLVKSSKEAGLLVNTWTANIPKDVQDLYARGVDFITTDFPTIPLLT